MTYKIESCGLFKAALPAVLFVASIFFFNFISRVILAPLMPVIQQDLGFSHAGAGHLFLALAVGNATGLLLSGFVSRAVTHRKTVGLSGVLVGLVAMATPMAWNYATLLIALTSLGLAVGLYLPSGIATIMSLVRKGDWGKTLAVHELAPSASFVVAPLLAEGVLLFFDWRVTFYLLGGLQFCLGLWFIKSGRGGNFPGSIPSPLMVMQIVKRPIFWLLTLFFSLAIGASLGPYSMLPLYLVDAHGYSRESANQLLSISRILACLGPFLAGWITDRWGPRPSIFLFLALTGMALIALSLASGAFLVTIAIVQPVFTMFMFAPGFTLLYIVFPPDQRSVAVALLGPLNALFGIGVVPTFLGHMGDAGRFDLGFFILGLVILLVMSFLPFLPRGNARQSV
ncbi:MAG: MFS transporter [Pseudodesulfovibrio sp.]|nr:MFS transporter [Pseudodesulfovibrio sp.]